jgi:H+/gluconate symporter-like permease
MFVLGMLWLNSRVAQAQKAGEGFGSLAPADEAAVKVSEDQPALPSAMAAFLPILCVIGLNFLFSQLIIPKWDASYLADEQFGKTELSKVVGQWSTILSLVITLLITASLHFRSIEKIKESLSAGAKSSLMPVFNTACEYGYGNTIKSLAGFTVVQNFVTGIAPGNPLISEAIAVNALAGITGSASGGLSIALRTLGETYYERAVAAGIDPQLLHRVASMSCGCLDSLPHNGALITLLLICGVTHRQSYRDVGVVTIVCPLIATAVVVALGTVFGSF